MNFKPIKKLTSNDHYLPHQNTIYYGIFCAHAGCSQQLSCRWETPSSSLAPQVIEFAY